VQECEEAGIEEVIIVVREEHSLIEDYFYKTAENVRDLLEMQGKLDRFIEVEKVLAMNNIKFVQQDPSLPYGNGSPVLSARHLINPGESFVMLFGDDMVLTKEKGAVKQLIEFYEEHPCDAVMAVQRVPQSEVNRYAIVKAKEEDKGDTFGVIDYLIEKPSIEQAPSDLASYGRQILPYKIFDYLTAEAIGKDNELWLQDANDKLSKDAKFMYKVIDGEWMTTGDPARYLGVQLKYYLANPKYHDSTVDLIKSLSL
jgi:UTP--glucose-1-phosphate uridylyltransferase